MSRIALDLVTLSAALAVVLVACGGEDPAPALPSPVVDPTPTTNEPPPPPTATERLHQGLTMSLRPDESVVHIGVSRIGEPQLVETITALEGAMGVAIPADRVTSSGLTLKLADVEISPSVFPPSGLHIGDIRVSLELGALDTRWVSPEEAELSGEAALHVAWALVRNGSHLPIRPIDVKQIPITGALSIGDDVARVTLALAAPGALLEVPGLGSLSDLALQLQLEEPAATTTSAP